MRGGGRRVRQEGQRLNWEVTGLTCTHDQVPWLEDAISEPIASDGDCPIAGVVVVLGAVDGGTHPDIKFHQARVGFKPVTELVFGGKEWPIAGKWEETHMSVKYGVVGD